MLQATTLLGDNTVPILHDLLAALRSRGLDVNFDDELPADERESSARSGAMDLVFACGLLTVQMQRDGAPLEVVGVPLFPGEREPVYRSVVVVRQESPIRSVDAAMAGRLAVNEYGSWSGWRAWEHHVAEYGHHAEEHPTHVMSGGHVHSMSLVRSGVADVAAIDSSIWNAAADADRAGLVVIDETQDWPAPPLSIVATMSSEVRVVVAEVIGASNGWVPADGSAHQGMLD
jgi:ABC-type phosphate/phosphonate transport system substrate-binding protein